MNAMLEAARIGARNYWEQITQALSLYTDLYPELKPLLQIALPSPTPYDQEGFYETKASTGHPGDWSAEG